MGGRRLKTIRRRARKRVYQKFLMRKNISRYSIVVVRSSRGFLVFGGVVFFFGQ